MICKNCGTNNSKNDTFCSYCGEKLDTRNYKNNLNYEEYRYEKNNKNKKIIILIVVILIFIGGYLLLGDKILNKDISISGIDINGKYEMNGETYVFSVNDSVIIEPEIEPSNKDVDLKYELSNDDVANISESNNKCSIVGLKEEKVNLNIYDGDKILKVMKISFENNSEKDKKVNEDNNSTNNQQNNTSDNSSQGNVNSNSTENIPSDELDYLMSNYFYDYEQATSYGDFSIISEDVTSDGDACKTLKKTVPSIYDKGITVELKGYDKVKMKKVSNGVYSVTYTVDWEIYDPQKDTLRLQRERADYIFKQSGGSYKVDHLENWQILSKQYL